MIHFILETSINNCNEFRVDFVKSPAGTFHLSDAGIDFIAWGDPIVSDCFSKKILQRPAVDVIIENVYGHYYFILQDSRSRRTIVGTSHFSLLPLYYAEKAGKLIFSENAIALGDYLGYKTLSKRYILEFILFNYPLFNHSIYDEINLVPSNSCISVDHGKWTIEKHTNIENWFVQSPVTMNNAKGELSEIFLSAVEKYLPGSKYYCSLTGGFDSRTLVAAGLFHGREFSTYGFGAAESKDIQIASAISEAIGVPFAGINLDEVYIARHSLNCGLEFISNASATASFARAHYLYSAREISKASEVIVTGNFGSELLRAIQNPGVVFSDNLLQLFRTDNPGKALASIESSGEFSLLRKESFIEAWEAFKQDVLTLPSFSKSFKGLTTNQKFYVYVFEEVFRKYFGAEMINQFYYLKNRTPFLDIEFVRALLKTRLAGVNSDFFERNPIKRFKGQVLYANIIQKAYPLLGKEMTDKGHKPEDLLKVTGIANIIKGYIRKKSNLHTDITDPNAVGSAFRNNQEYFGNIRVSPDLFRIESPALNSIQNKQNESYFRILSISSII